VRSCMHLHTGLIRMTVNAETKNQLEAAEAKAADLNARLEDAAKQLEELPKLTKSLSAAESSEEISINVDEEALTVIQKQRRRRPFLTLNESSLRSSRSALRVRKRVWKRFRRCMRLLLLVKPVRFSC
jgi:predicted  nucleic acid-binding Zn-ribbon protein